MWVGDWIMDVFEFSVGIFSNVVLLGGFSYVLFFFC